MAKTRFIQNNFTSGVLSPLLKGRTDINQYYNGLEKAENWVTIPQGGIKRRPGTRFIDDGLNTLVRNTTVPTMPEGGTPADINDGDDSTTTSTTTAMGTISPYVVAQYDLGAPTLVKFVDVIGISTSTTPTDGFRVDYSDDAISWTNAGNPPNDIGPNPQDFRIDVESVGAHRYWRLQRSSVLDLGSDVTTLAEFNIQTESSTTSNINLQDFSVSVDEHYLFVFSDKSCSIYERKDPSEADTVSTFKAAIPMPYTSDEVPDIKTIQTENVMLVFHENHPTKRIISLTPTLWTTDDFPYTNVPEFDYNDSLSPTPVAEVQDLTFNSFTVGQQFQIDVEGILSKNITFAGDGSADEQSATAENIRKNLQDMPNFGDTGISVARTGVATYRITIDGESADSFELFSGFPTTGAATDNITFAKVATGTARKEPVWSETRGYPKMGIFHEGRMVIGGTKSKPQSLFFSKSGLFYNFELDEQDDDDAIFITIASRTLTDIVGLVSGRDLQVFTSGSEFVQFTSPITPQTANIRLQTSHGSLNVEPKEIDGATLFLDRSGKSLKQFLYNFNEDAYTSNDISVLSPELIKTPVSMAILGGTNSDDANWVFIVNSDGTATVLNTLREQDINAFTTWTTTGEILSAAVVDDQLYMCTKRTVGGSEVTHIEQWNFSRLLDDSLLQVNTAPTNTISNLDHLEGLTVGIVADGSVLPDRVVSGGSITLTEDEEFHTNVEVGLRFTPALKCMPVNTNVGSGQNQMRRRKILRMNARVSEAYGLYIEGNPIPARNFDTAASSPLGAAPDAKTGIIEDIYSQIGWDRYDSMPEFTLPDPTPCTILAIEYEVESS